MTTATTEINFRIYSVKETGKVFVEIAALGQTQKVEIALSDGQGIEPKMHKLPYTSKAQRDDAKRQLEAMKSEMTTREFLTFLKMDRCIIVN